MRSCRPQAIGILFCAACFSLTLVSAQSPQSAADQPETQDSQPKIFSHGLYPPSSPQENKEAVPASPPPNSAPQTRAAQQTLSPELEQIARRAWQYFLVSQNNGNGLFDSILGYHHATMWDIASGMAGVVCAERLHIISRNDAVARLSVMVKTLSSMPLYGGKLPNREYKLSPLQMLDIHSQVSAQGSGWSATDLGRLLVWLKIAALWYPELKSPIEQMVGRWKLPLLVRDGEIYGAYYAGLHEKIRQEGRLGYEQYAATGLSLWGLKPAKAFAYDNVANFTLYGVTLLRDRRNRAALTSEPFFLARMEIGSVDAKFDDLERNLFAVQKKRWQSTGLLTAVSEDSWDRAPWFLYNTVSFEQILWACVTPAGRPYPSLSSVSVKTGIAWRMLYDDEYAARVFDSVKEAFDPQRGYYAGTYGARQINRSLNVNTNAIVLEAVLYRFLGNRSFLATPADAP